MVIDHQFISTLDAGEVFGFAEAYLSTRGFRRSGTESERWIEFRRGVTASGKAKSITELPQRVRIEFDRGRVSVAAQIEASGRWGGAGSFQISSTGGNENRKKMVVHEKMLMGMVTGLQALLAHDGIADYTYAAWDAAETEASELVTRHQRRQKKLIVIAVLLIAATVAMPFIFAALL
jgi:hypothetical protein